MWKKQTHKKIALDESVRMCVFENNPQYVVFAWFVPEIKVAGLIEPVLDPGLREQAEEHR